MFRNISILGIIIGAWATLVVYVAQSSFMPIVFLSLLIDSGKSDVLITSFWPRIYTLGALFFSGVAGIISCAVFAKRVSWINSLAVILITVLMVYAATHPSSVISRVFPAWFVIAGYSLCAAALLTGHFAARFWVKEETQPAWMARPPHG